MSQTAPRARLYPSLPILPLQTSSRPVRVCIASMEFIGPTRNGGIATACTSLARALADAGHEVTRLYVNVQHTSAEELQSWIETYRTYGVTLTPVPEITKPVLAGPPHFVKSFETFQWLKANDRFDVVHFPECYAPGYHTLAAREQGLAFQRTIICVGIHGMTAWVRATNQDDLNNVSELGLDFMERQSVALADMVVSPSRHTLDWIVERGWQLPEKCYVQQHVLPQSARRTLSTEPETMREINELVFFGRLETRKGVVLFCDALDRLSTADAGKIKAVSFLGREDTVEGVPGLEYVKRRAQRWTWKTETISDRNQIQAMDYLRGPNRLAVIPALDGNYGLTVVECLGAGIPFLLANEVGAVQEVVAQDVARVCFPPTPNDLCQRLSNALNVGAKPARAAVDAVENERAWTRWHEILASETPVDCGAAARTSWPRVSLCLTTFNRPSLLRQALASIEMLAYPNLEVVLVDDGSTEPDALAVLAELEPVFAQRHWRIVRQDNRYLGAARNTAARHATCDFFLFMDDDNWCGADEISTLTKAALHTGADIVACGMNYFEGDQPPNIEAGAATRFLPLGGAVAVGAFENCFGDANFLVRRACFENAGGFTEDKGLAGEDWEFLARAVLQGFHLTVVPEFLFWHRLHPVGRLRASNQHRTQLRSLRPYVAAAPPVLQPLVRFARAQYARVNKLSCPPAPRLELPPVETPLIIAWRSRFEAARLLARENRPDIAVRLLIEAVKSVESSRNSEVILDALLTVGAEMRSLDSGRAEYLLQLAANLAEGTGNEAGKKSATDLLALLRSRSGAPKNSIQALSAIVPPIRHTELAPRKGPTPTVVSSL